MGFTAPPSPKEPNDPVAPPTSEELPGHGRPRKARRGLLGEKARHREGTSSSLRQSRPAAPRPSLLPPAPARAALTGQHHRPPPERVIEKTGAIAQEADVGEPRVGQLGRGQAPGLIWQEL